jgi:predicted DNA-binding transcriptional regulator AlpA
MYMRRRYSTVQVAQKLGLDQANLQKLIRQKRIPFPPLVKVGALKIRLWSDHDVARARKVLAKRRAKRGQK